MRGAQQMNGKGTPRPRLAELDALRGIGALLVLNFHYSTRFQELFPSARHVPFSIVGGNYRVLLFFAISGFAIFFTMNRLQSGWDFVAGRFARLFPAYWAAMCLTLLVEHWGHVPQLDVSPSAIWVNITMLQGFFYVPAVDGAYWTLTVELAFYACMLFLWWIKGLAQVERAVLGWLGLKLIFHAWPDMPDRLVSLLVLRWIPFFAIGMLSYRVWAGQRSWREQAPYVLAVFATIALTEAPDLLLVAILFVLIFALAIKGHVRWLCVRPLMWVGSISYSLYLVHQHIGFVIMVNGDRMGLSPLMSYAIALATAFLLGALINRTVERPGTEWILRQWRERGWGVRTLHAD